VTAWGGVCSKVSWKISKPVDYVYVPDNNVKNTDEIYYSSITSSGNNRTWKFDLGEPSYTKYVTISVVWNAANRKTEEPITYESKEISYSFFAKNQEYFPRTFNSGTERCYTTDRIFVPVVFQGVYPELRVTAPKDFYVIVKSDGVNVNDMLVNDEREQQKRQEI
jgi:hypothetical protein